MPGLLHHYGYGICVVCLPIALVRGPQRAVVGDNSGQCVLVKDTILSARLHDSFFYYVTSHDTPPKTRAGGRGSPPAPGLITSVNPTHTLGAPCAVKRASVRPISFTPHVCKPRTDLFCSSCKFCSLGPAINKAQAVGHAERRITGSEGRKERPDCDAPSLCEL